MQKKETTYNFHKMNILFLIPIIFAFFSSTVGEEMEMNNEKSNTMNFYKCVSCGGSLEAQKGYGNCGSLKTETTQKQVTECRKQMNVYEFEEADFWNYMCQNPTTVAKIHDCWFTEEYLKSLTEEDENALKAYKECLRGVYKVHCS